MWFIAGESNSLNASFVSCLQHNNIAFDKIHTTYHPDGEMQFNWPLITASFQHVFLQLQSQDHTYISALSLSRELQTKMRQVAGSSCELVICFPYMPYARNPYLLDVMLSNEYRPTRSKLPRLTNGPAVRFVAVDIHDSSDTRICNLYPAGLFAEQIRTLIGVNKNCFVFAPDKGSTWRANQVAEELHVPILIVNKTRHRDNSCTLHTVGSSNDFDLHECVKNLEFGVLVDDIVASGQTLRAAVSFIKNLGIKHIIAVITHTVIAPDEKLLNDIDVWITTNTHTSSFKSVQVDIAPFVVTEITRLTRK